MKSWGRNSGKLIVCAFATLTFSACSQHRDEVPSGHAAGSDAHASTKQAASKEPQVPSHWKQSIFERIAAGEYAVRTQGSVLGASNRAQGLRALWSNDGLELKKVELSSASADPILKATATPKSTEVSTLKLRTVGVTRGSGKVSVGQGPFAMGRCQKDGAIDESGQCLKRAERRAAAVTEWWENSARGLEQGFDFERADRPERGKTTDPRALQRQVHGRGR
jgi:hypothetical protein